MPLSTMFALDLAAISVLTFVLYFPRHRRKDMVVAFLGINVGVLGVTQALASAGVSAGLGLGLFGVLSIIRLRSAEIEQEEVAYYFAALALGLLGGITVTPGLADAGVDDFGRWRDLRRRPSGVRQLRNQLMNLDATYTDEDALRARLEELLDTKVRRVDVRKVDLVDGTCRRGPLPADQRRSSGQRRLARRGRVSR